MNLNIKVNNALTNVARVHIVNIGEAGLCSSVCADSK